MLIVEGADGTGKTVLAKRIVELANEREKYPVHYSHMTRPPDHFDHMRDYEDMMSRHAVQDRFHLSEMAYPRRDLTEEKRLWVEGQLMIRGSFLIILIAHDGEWLRSKIEDGQIYDADTIVRANFMFKEMSHYVWNDALYSVDVRGYPGDAEINGWIDQWFARLVVTS